jgi:hypothetical protein
MRMWDTGWARRCPRGPWAAKRTSGDVVDELIACSGFKLSRDSTPRAPLLRVNILLRRRSIIYTVYFVDRPDPSVISASQFVYSEQDGYIFLDESGQEIARYQRGAVLAFTEGIPFWLEEERGKQP